MSTITGIHHITAIAGEPQQNIDFVHEFLASESIPIVSEDIGGYQARRVLFNTNNAKVYMKKLGTNEAERTAEEEMVYLISLKRRRTDGDVHLF